MSKDLLNNIVEEIVNEVNAEKIILFGSYARGEENENSDLDLLIIEKESFKNRSRREEITRVRDRLSKFRVPKDILIYDENEIDEWKDSINHVIARSLREGIVLYER